MTTSAEADAGDRLLQLVGALNVPHGYERSIKLRSGALQLNRFLLTIARATIADDARLFDLFRALEMPEPIVAAARERIADARLVHFGFEEETGGRCFYKAYLEFPYAGGAVPFLLHLAFKWPAHGEAPARIARYTCVPRLDRSALLRHIADIYAHRTRRIPWDVACGLLAEALRRVDARDLMYLDVDEQATSRRSFDLNLYPAGLTLDAVVPFSGALSRHFALPAAALDDALAASRGRQLGHMAGGADRHGEDFFTLYFGVEARA